MLGIRQVLVSKNTHLERLCEALRVPKRSLSTNSTKVTLDDTPTKKDAISIQKLLLLEMEMKI